MSRTSHIKFYRTEALIEPAQIIKNIVKVMRPVGSIRIRTSNLPDHSWEAFQAESRGEDVEDTILQSEEELISNVNPDVVDTFFEPDGILSMSFTSGLGHLKNAVVSGIPEHIRGNFGPINLVVRIGHHDLWECVEHDDGFYYDRASLSFDFWGYRGPEDNQLFRDAVFQLPAVLSMQQLLENTVGQLKRCFYSVG